MKIAFDVLGSGIAAPGLVDWDQFTSVLDGNPLHDDRSVPASTLLSARERRRAPATVKLSFAAAEQACGMARVDPARPEAVFSSAMGDIEISDYMCRTLAKDPDMLSPTRFHNSVHNAAAGYWSIGSGATGDVTALSGYRDSAAVGMIEAITRVSLGQCPVLAVVYDNDACGPLRDLWPSRYAFASALLLARPGHHDKLATPLYAELVGDAGSGEPLPEPLNERMEDNPAARMLPLLALLAGRITHPVVFAVEQGRSLRIGKRAE